MAGDYFDDVLKLAGDLGCLPPVPDIDPGSLSEEEAAKCVREQVDAVTQAILDSKHPQARQRLQELLERHGMLPPARSAKDEARRRAEQKDVDEIRAVVRRVAQRAMGRVYNREEGAEWAVTMTLTVARSLLYERQSASEFKEQGARLNQDAWDRALAKACALVPNHAVPVANDP